MSKPTIDFAREQQIACAEYILAGGPDQRGVRLGLFDWFAEEILMEEERINERKDSQASLARALRIDEPEPALLAI